MFRLMSRWTIFALAIVRHPAYYLAYLRSRKQAEQGDPFSPMNVASLRSDGGGRYLGAGSRFTVDWVVSFSGIARATSILIFFMR